MNNNHRKILVTGATGFIGAALCRRLQQEGWTVIGAVRSMSTKPLLPCEVNAVEIGSIGTSTKWKTVLKEVDIVVHLAARTHVTRETGCDSLKAYRQLNVEGTAHLAREAAAADIKRFIFLSSIKVNGEGRSERFTEKDPASPEDAYGISKWEAEQAIKRIASDTGMEVVVIRPPLVYGPEVKANFLSLIKAVDRRIPLPFAGICNKRSLIYLGNLVDAIMTCIVHPKAAGQMYLVSDGEDVSTSDLIQRIGDALGRKAYLFPFPQRVMKAVGTLSGKSDVVDRLYGSLTLDSTKIRRDLNWTPLFSMGQGLEKTMEWFKQRPK